MGPTQRRRGSVDDVVDPVAARGRSDHTIQLSTRLEALPPANVLNYVSQASVNVDRQQARATSRFSR